MLPFTGKYTYALDEKNRVIIPVKFREILAAESVDKLYVVKGDSHLFLFPLPVFLELSHKLKSWDFTRETNQNYARLFFSESFDVVPDKQGRIMLPKEMCESAGINHEVAIIGVLDRMEIWAPERWNQFRKDSSLRGFSMNL
jgi:MraZ protein